MQKDSKYYEKLECVFRAYESSLDLDIAMTVVPLSAVEREELLQDKELEARITVLDAKNKGDMVEHLRKLSTSASSEGVQLAALKELGRTYYPKRFKDAEANQGMPRQIRYMIVEPTA